MNRILPALSAALVIALIIQLYFAAFGAFGDRDATGGFAIHEAVARFVLAPLAILTPVGVALARRPGRVVAIAFLPFALIVVQFLLFLVARLLGSETHPGGADLAGAVVLGLHGLAGVGTLAVAVRLLWLLRPTAGRPAAGPATR